MSKENQTDSQKTEEEEYSPPAEPKLKRTDTNAVDPYGPKPPATTKSSQSSQLTQAKTIAYNDLANGNAR